MITKHGINETLAGNIDKDQKIAFLEATQDMLTEELSDKKIDKANHDNLYKYTENKAREILGLLLLK